MNCYCFRNKLAGAFLLPFFDILEPKQLEEQMLRSAQFDSAGFKEKHYDEHELYYLGKFDQDSASFSLLEKPELISDLGTIYERVTNLKKSLGL